MRQRPTLSLTRSRVFVDGAQPVRVRDQHWRAALVEALAPFAKTDVEVHLGFDHARVAIMNIDQPDGLASLPAAKHDTFVQAWAADVLHVVPHEHIIRWRALTDPRKVLVSCVRRDIVEAVNAACGEARARLASCRPAVLSAMDNVRPDAMTVVWTEGESETGRHGVVQLLQFTEQRLTRSWRGWLPQASDVEDALSRFEAGGARVDVLWPMAKAA